MWDDIVATAMSALEARQLGSAYQQRLRFELEEIHKQGAEMYWTGLVQSGKRFPNNPNHLVLPWLLGMVDADPLMERPDQMLCTTRHTAVRAYTAQYGVIPSDMVKDPDMPDIDLDCLPEAREHIRDYAIETYGTVHDGYGNVCSVGTWSTYLLRSALLDVAGATRLVDKSIIYALTESLPDEVDDLKEGGISVCKGRILDGSTGEERDCKTLHALEHCPKCGAEDTEYPTLGKLLAEHAELRAFSETYHDVLDFAVRLIGRIRSMGKHAGALIIADRPLYGNVPLAKKKDGGWISMWTEGRSTQLSKFGYIKWDVLGIKNLKYCERCCELIEQNRGVSFGKSMSGWDDIDPMEGRAGHYFTTDADGTQQKHIIDLHDADALALANKSSTDAVFQFDTPLAMSILSHGVRNFHDLMLLNSMGHPGPMNSIPDAIANRDDPQQLWKLAMHPKVLPILEETYGQLCYQEQLTMLWQTLAGFTGPEAQEARKAVAKKWKHKLIPIEQKWVTGATAKIGKEEAERLWQSMIFFARYAFNKCLDVDTLLKDAITGEVLTVAEWNNATTLPYLYSLNDTGEVVVDKCVAIHDNGDMEVFEITFGDGSVERVTLDHQFRCTDGRYYTVREIIDQGLDITTIGPSQYSTATAQYGQSVR